MFLKQKNKTKLDIKELEAEYGDIFNTLKEGKMKFGQIMKFIRKKEWKGC